MRPRRLPLIRLGFRKALEGVEGLSVVGDAVDGADAIERVSTLRPDVVLLHIRMPKIDGLEAIRAIMAADPGARILILTTFDLDEYTYSALNAGASGFLLKDAPVEDLLNAISAIADGHAVFAPRITRLLLTRFASQLPSSSGDNSARVKVTARLATANVALHIDVNGGGAIWPAPTEVILPLRWAAIAATEYFASSSR